MLVHKVHEAVEEILGIVRACGCFRVILDAEDRQLFVLQPFDGVVVQVDV